MTIAITFVKLCVCKIFKAEINIFCLLYAMHCVKPCTVCCCRVYAVVYKMQLCLHSVVPTLDSCTVN